VFKRILVPLDSSRFSSQALRYATKIAQQFDADIILMQVVHSATPIAATDGDFETAENPSTTKIAIDIAIIEDNRHVVLAKRYLSRKMREISSHGIKGSYHVVVGNPSQSIIEFAWGKHIDLVVMTTHGKSGLKRAIMGSVADTVIRESGKPVLVIRPKTLSKK